MNTVSNNNRFYRTFTPFITPQTRTAEKTLHGKEYSVYTPPKNLLSKFYSYISAGGFLLIPILSLLLSKKNLFDMINNSNKEIFRAMNSENQTFLTKAGIHVSKFKNALAQKTLKFSQAFECKKEVLANNLYNNKNKSFCSKIFKKVTDFFLQQKTNAHLRNIKNIQIKFNTLEKIVNKQADIIEQSGQGKLKIAFPKHLLKNPNNELPQAIDLSKTGAGKNRAEEIRKTLKEIKELLTNKSAELHLVGKNLSYSCEEIFRHAENRLTQINKAIKFQSESTPKIQGIMKDLYSNLLKYRYAENIENLPHAKPEVVRKIYLQRMQDLFTELKQTIKHPEKMSLQFDDLEKLLFKGNPTSAMGLLENLRHLLKCNDIKHPLIKDNISPSLFKQFKTEDYIKTKRLINDLAKEIKFAEKTEIQFLPQAHATIKKGHPFIDALSVAVPATCLATEYATQQKKKEQRNLASFLLGSLTMMGSHYLTMCSIPTAIINGLITAFITSKIYNKFHKD